MAGNFIVQTFCMSLLWRTLSGIALNEYPLIQVYASTSMTLLEWGLSTVILRFWNGRIILLKKVLLLWGMLGCLGSVVLFTVLKMTLANHSPLLWLILSLAMGAAYSLFTIASAPIRAAKYSRTYAVLNTSKNLGLLFLIVLAYVRHYLDLYIWMNITIAANFTAALISIYISNRLALGQTNQTHQSIGINGNTTLQPNYKAILAFAIPLWASQLIYFSESFIDIAFLKFYFPTHLIAYRQAMEYALFLTAIIQAMRIVWSPILYHRLSTSIPVNAQLTGLLANLFSSCLALIFGLVLPWLLTIYIGSSLTIEALSITWILLGSAQISFVLFWLRPWDEYKENTRFLLVLSLVSACINILGNFLFTPMYGGIAAGLSACAATIFCTYFLWVRHRPSVLQSIQFFMVNVLFWTFGYFIFTQQAARL